jgi:hypothetical protein
VNQYQYINFNNNLYIVRRKFKTDQLKPNFDTNLMKEWTRTDVLLRKDGLLYCCELVPNAEIIEQ